MIIPGLVSVTFRDQPAEWIIKQCQTAKLQAIEWSEAAHIAPDDPTGAGELYRKTMDAGLAIAAYGSYYRLGQQEDPEQVFLKSLRSAAALKAPVLRIWAGVKPSAEVTEAELVCLSKEAAVVAGMAADYGIKVALEWHRNTLTDTNESAQRFMQMAEHKNLYCLWQPTVALSMEERVAGIELMGERILNLHIYYWQGSVKRPLQEGVAEWQQYLSHVNKEVPRYGLIEFVMDGTKEQFQEDAKTLHQMLKMG